MSKHLKRIGQIGAVLVFGAALLCAIWYGFISQPVSTHPLTVRYVKVQPGQSADAIGQTLKRQGLIRSVLAFRLLSRERHLARSLKSGVYRISSGQSLSQILNEMQRGQTVVIRVSIPEGFSVQQIVKRLVQHGIGTTAQYQKLLTHPLPGFPTPEPGVRDPYEGYLLPDTYEFPWGTNGAQALRIMWDNFQQRAIPLYRQNSAALPVSLTLSQWVTLASMVQAEAKEPQDASKIAAVFFNRLKKQMYLQSDATVRYALEPSAPVNLDWTDLNVSSPFNTYRSPGLPPGPIDNPGLANLKAALKPANVPYLFFLGLNNGHTLYATTYADQQRNIQKAIDEHELSQP